jgi:hypothetical protein
VPSAPDRGHLQAEPDPVLVITMPGHQIPVEVVQKNQPSNWVGGPFGKPASDLQAR